MRQVIVEHVGLIFEGQDGERADHVVEPPESVLGVEEFEDDAELERGAEEHGGVAAARLVRALQEPQGVAHQLLEHVLRQQANLCK